MHCLELEANWKDLECWSVAVEQRDPLFEPYLHAVPNDLCAYEASPFSRLFLCSTSRLSSHAFYQTKKINGIPICQAPAQSQFDFLGWITTHSRHSLYSKSLWPQTSVPPFQVCHLQTIEFAAEQTRTQQKCKTKKRKEDEKESEWFPATRG